MRTIKVTICDEDSYVIDTVEVQVADDVRKIALVPLAGGRDCIAAIEELTIGAPK